MATIVLVAIAVKAGAAALSLRNQRSFARAA